MATNEDDAWRQATLRKSGSGPRRSLSALADTSRDIRRAWTDVRDVIGRWKQQHPAGPLSTQLIMLWALVVLVIGLTAFIVLWWRYGGAGPSVELDVVRTTGGIMIATGGALTLLLAARRQAYTERDSGEQRITELYAHAVDQLGSEKAPVRLSGLHALERLAQNNPVQRQTVADVICAYLRRPYLPPEDQAPSEDAPEDAHRRYKQGRQELQVRLTAQYILTAHLKPEKATAFWADIDLNLTDAYLHQLDLTDCHIRNAQFDGVMFAKNTGFMNATFAGDARFDRASFAEDARFNGAKFAGATFFDWARFQGIAQFDGAKFARGAGFREARFDGDAEFSESEFTLESEFKGAKFAGYTEFDDAKFAHAIFSEAKFAGRVVFYGAEIFGDALFKGAEFTENFPPEFDRTRVRPTFTRSTRVVLPRGWTTRPAQAAEGKDDDWLYVVRDGSSTEQHIAATDDGEDQTCGDAGT